MIVIMIIKSIMMMMMKMIMMMTMKENYKAMVYVLAYLTPTRTYLFVSEYSWAQGYEQGPTLNTMLSAYLHPWFQEYTDDIIELIVNQYLSPDQVGPAPNRLFTRLECLDSNKLSFVCVYLDD